MSTLITYALTLNETPAQRFERLLRIAQNASDSAIASEARRLAYEVADSDAITEIEEEAIIKRVRSNQ